METRFICPLGAKCEEARDGAIHRCAWYTKVVGKDPQSESSFDEWRCAMAWLPILLVNVAATNQGQTQAICSFRDETIGRQDVLNTILGACRGPANLQHPALLRHTIGDGLTIEEHGSQSGFDPHEHGG